MIGFRRDFLLAFFVSLFVFLALPVFSQLAEEMIIRADLRRSENGRYKGLVYNETRVFANPYFDDGGLPRGSMYQYRLEQLTRDGRMEARLVQDEDWTEYSFEPESSSYGDRFATPYTRDFGSLSVPPEKDILVYQNFPVPAPEPLREGLVWQAPGAYLTDPYGSGNLTRIPVLVEYRVVGKTDWVGQESWAVSVLFALRYQGNGPNADPFGDPDLLRAQGRHEGVIYYQAPDITPENSQERELPVFYRLTVDELYQGVRGEVGNRGFILGFLSFPFLQSGPGTQDIGGPLVPQVAEPPEAEDQTQVIADTLRDSSVQDVQVTRVPEGYNLELQNLLFVADREILLPGETARLDSIAQVLAQFPERQFLVTGHTAAVGTVESQESLSVLRARTIVDALIERGIAASRLMYEGKGGSEPIADNGTEEGRQQNRRVEITIIAPR